MKKKSIIGILLLIIINLIFIYLICIYPILSFGLVVAEIGEVQGKVIETKITRETILFVLLLSVFVLSINYLIFKKLILTKRNFLFSLALIIIGILIFFPFYLNSKKSFLDYQNGTTKLGHFIEKNEIENIIVIKQNDTIIIKAQDIFLNEIGRAKYKRGIWKYDKKYKIIFEKNGIKKDSILSNGIMFGAFKNKHFQVEKDVIKKYFNTKKSNG
ncbi:hypothetical protein [Flavobacterium sp.]|jgi:hypothetical protein|uniref:hypothetical protein n=1 Tax=Flavobacterium sp. TaxID=239 RepID=UPI0037BEC94E